MLRWESDRLSSGLIQTETLPIILDVLLSKQLKTERMTIVWPRHLIAVHLIREHEPFCSVRMIFPDKFVPAGIQRTDPNNRAVVGARSAPAQKCCSNNSLERF